MDNDKNLRKNAEGYSDPTAYQGIKNAEKAVENQIRSDILKNAMREAAFHKLLDTIFTICELSGFHVEGRITISDKETGKVWR